MLLRHAVLLPALLGLGACVSPTAEINSTHVLPLQTQQVALLGAFPASVMPGQTVLVVDSPRTRAMVDSLPSFLGLTIQSGGVVVIVQKQVHVSGIDTMFIVSDALQLTGFSTARIAVPMFLVAAKSVDTARVALSPANLDMLKLAAYHNVPLLTQIRGSLTYGDSTPGTIAPADSVSFAAYLSLTLYGGSRPPPPPNGS